MLGDFMNIEPHEQKNNEEFNMHWKEKLENLLLPITELNTKVQYRAFYS
jgi:hypothetical protein